jgi:hypothetical protein
MARQLQPAKVAHGDHNRNYEPLHYIHINNDIAVMAAFSSKHSSTTPVSVTNARLKKGPERQQNSINNTELQQAF